MTHHPAAVSASRLYGLVCAGLAGNLIGWPTAKQYHAMIDTAVHHPTNSPALMEECAATITADLRRARKAGPDPLEQALVNEARAAIQDGWRDLP